MGIRVVPLRPILVWLHRWVGLAMAAFLLVEGVTGSILAFEGPIGRWLAPHMQAPASEESLPVLDLASLATIAERLEPQVQVAYFSNVRPDQAILRCIPRLDPATGKPFEGTISHVVLDPHNGRELARLTEGRPADGGAASILPFIRDLHYNLAIGGAGSWIFFVLALAWTVDCFVSLALTLPRSARRFLARWKPAWLIKWRAGGYRLNFDLHRAGGLWFWLLAFAFAWSSVTLEDHGGTYDWVMGTLFDYLSPERDLADWPTHGPQPLRMDWFEAQRRGEELMAQRARQRGFRILAPTGLVRFDQNGLYNYSVRTDRSFPQVAEETVFFDGDTGRLFLAPGFQEARLGNNITDWLRALHMVLDPVDFLAYRLLVFLFGLVLSLFCVTGIVIWLRKRRARLFEAARRPVGAARIAPR